MATQKIEPFAIRRFLISGVILLLAFALRIWGIHFGLPHLYHADEPIVVNHALSFSTGDFNPHFFNIPPLTSYILFIIYGLLFLMGKLIGVWGSAQQFAEHFFQDPSLFYITGRLMLGVIPAVITVHGLMTWLRQSCFSEFWVYLGGFLLAICFVHVSDAHYIYADIPLVLTSVIFFCYLHRANLALVRSHFLLGLMIGLATAFKYNGFFLVIPYLWMLLRSLSLFKAGRLLFLLGISGISCIVTFILLNPYSILDFHFFINELKEQSAANQGVPFFHHLSYSLAEGMSWPLIALGLVGLARSFFTRDSKIQSVTIFCIFYYLILWQKGQPYGRYILPLVPLMIYLAVDAARFISKSSSCFRAVIVVMLSVAVIINITKDIRFDLIMSRLDTRTQASDWIQNNLATGSKIALDGTSFSPRLNFTCAQLKQKINNGNDPRLLSKLNACEERPGYEIYFLTKNPGSNPFVFASPELAWDLEEWRDKQIQYLAIIPEFHSAQHVKMYLGSSAKLLKVWEPRPNQSDPSEVFDSQIITGGPFKWKDLLTRQRNGYRIELYEVV